MIWPPETTWREFRERLAEVLTGNGSVSFRALVNNNCVTAENAGAAPLIANRTAIGPWEEFDLIAS